MFGSVVNWFQDKIVNPFHALPLPGKLVAFSFGSWFGLFPVPGASTLLLLLTYNVLAQRKASFNRAQIALSMGVNLLMTPVMIMLLPVWLGLASFFFGLPECSASDIIPAFSKSVVQAILQFTSCLTAAAACWLVLTPFLLGPFYLIQKRSLRELPEDRVPLNGMGSY